MVDNFLQSVASETTRRTYRYTLGRFERYLSGSGGTLSNLTRADVQAYFNHLQQVEKLNATTINTDYRIIASFCRFSGQGFACEGIRKVKAPHGKQIAPKALERLDRNKLLRDVERTESLRDIAIVYMLIYLGLRVSELIKLNIDDIELTERSETSRCIIRAGKGNKQRVLPIPSEVRHHLGRYLATRADDSPALFIGEKINTDRFSVRGVQRLLQKYGYTPHMLRHTLAKSLVDKGKPLTVVADILGHTDINTTRRYAKPTVKDIANAMDDAYN